MEWFRGNLVLLPLEPSSHVKKDILSVRCTIMSVLCLDVVIEKQGLATSAHVHQQCRGRILETFCTVCGHHGFGAGCHFALCQL
jgi:hypothetical protein